MTISVVVPVYNGERFVERCLDALSKQIRPPDEVIIVDDGSTDQSVALVESKPVQLIRQKHQGPAAARNRGVQAAAGELILFTDIDCEPEPAWVLEMEKSLSLPEVVGVKGAYATKQTGIVPRLVQLEFEERYDLLEKSPQIDLIDTYSAGFHRENFQHVGGFNPALQKNEDVDLSYRLATARNKLVFNRNAIVYHHHPENYWAYFISKMKKAYWRMIVYRAHPGKAIKDSYTPQLLKLQILLALLALLAIFFVGQSPISIWIAMILWGGLILTMIPFLRRVVICYPRLAVFAVIFIIIRSYAFVVGVILGIVSFLFIKPEIHPLAVE